MPHTELSRVMVVEDDEDIQRIIRIALARIGKLEVEILGDATKAIAAMVAFRPDLVVLDWMMPGIDGTVLFRQMRAMSGLADVPVVFLTAKVTPEAFAKLDALGAAAVIAKPFAPLDFAENLKRIWNRSPATS